MKDIGPPLHSRAEGLEAIVKMLRCLMQSERYFMQMTHPGAVTIKGTNAPEAPISQEIPGWIAALISIGCAAPDFPALKPCSFAAVDLAYRTLFGAAVHNHFGTRSNFHVQIPPGPHIIFTKTILAQSNTCRAAEF
ncbi:MAG TPA: hypothetical protein VFW28_13730 [Micropepsaceae bacterium]|nr:hypothetical protein [Micropepsaceae bacterium]